MLSVLRESCDSHHINLNREFHRDLRWFATFLPQYNGISLYNRSKMDYTLELDACLQGLGAKCGNLVYHLPIPTEYSNLGIVQLEMVNILVATRVFAHLWKGKNVHIRCDNQAVVQVLNTGRTKDPFLAACARNIWMESAKFDIDFKYTHILGKLNRVADLLSRWSYRESDFLQLQTFISDPLWMSVSPTLLELNNII